MAELLFEIFCEEIPARMQKRAGDDLQKAMDAGLKEAGLSPSGSSVLTGPRRLTYVTDVEPRSPDVSEERKGPRVGSPERALAGFMRGAGISDISEAETRSDKKGEFYVAVIQKPGRDTAEVLQGLIPEVMGKFPWPKSMKTGASDFRWVRPLRGLTVLHGGASIDVEVGGIASDDHVHGHRQMGAGPFTVTGLADYRDQLEGEGHVMLGREARKARVLEQAKAVCAVAGLELVEDAGLLDEVTGLVEWPVALLGDMDEAFLELPDEVIRLTLKSHQKTFTVRDPKTGKLAPHFVILANLETPDDGATIKAGNAKVISARLSDARFFQDEDRKKNLIDYYDQLDTVVFHNKLGSIRDKADRVAALAREIAPHVGADPDAAELAAKLSKCDLVTQTVIEATSLQGQIGRMMYEAEGGDPAIALAIEEHYKPQGPSDAVPTAPVSIAVALADKLDSLFEFFHTADEKPTGSKDPFALRRAGLGMLSIEIENGVEITPRWYFETHAKLNHSACDYIEYAASVDQIEIFLADRLENYLKLRGHRLDTVEAVSNADFSTGTGLSHFVWYERALNLEKFLSNANGENLVQGYKRAANILKAEAKKAAVPGLDPGSIEGTGGSGDQGEWAPEQVQGRYTAIEANALADALLAADPAISEHLESNNYPAALTTLASLREPIDAFFEHVVVNSDEPDERARRLALLQAIVTCFHRLADFSRLDG